MTIKSLSSSQIALILKKGRAYNSGSFLLKFLDDLDQKDVIMMENQTSEVSLFGGAFIASKKIFPKAVDRNNAKRILRESFRKAVQDIKKNTEKAEDNKKTIILPYFVFLAKKELKQNEFSNIVSDVRQIILKEYIIK